ncbi:MAG TPA: VanZ family protein [Verrucomicrobiales bacterium]|nr:VanZ family protein [Verrucomicrobiales bacterium]
MNLWSRPVRRGQLWLKHNAGWRGRWAAGFCLWVVLLWIVSSTPGGGDDEGGILIRLPPGSDKAAHFALFALGGFCLFPVLGLGRPSGGGGWQWRILWAVLVMAVFGFLDEWHQTSVPGRTGGDVWDWTADVCGGAFGATMFWLFTRRGPDPGTSLPKSRIEEGRAG